MVSALWRKDTVLLWAAVGILWIGLACAPQPPTPPPSPPQPPPSPTVSPAQAKAVSDHAKSVLGMGKKDARDEIVRLGKALASDPGLEMDWARKGWAQLAKGDPAGAERSLRQALRIRPFHAHNHLAMAHALLAQGKTGDLGWRLAHAQHCSVRPFNHLGRHDIADFLQRIVCDDLRAPVRAEMQDALATNTFARLRPRHEILALAAQTAPVLATRRDPLNKYHLWIMLEGRFLKVFDGERDAFVDLAPGAPDGLRSATVSHLAIKPTCVWALADGTLLRQDRAKGSWEIVAPPPEAANAKARSLAAEEGGVLVRFGKTYFRRKGGGMGWKEVPGREAKIAARLARDEKARAFCEARYGSPGKRPDFAAEAALAQYRDLGLFLAACGSHKTPEDVLTPEGRLDAAFVKRLAAEHGAQSNQRLDAFRGITLPAWHRGHFEEAMERRWLERFKELGANWVAVVNTSYQNDPLALEVLPDPEKTPSLESLEAFVKYAHGLGLKVLLKPHVDLQVAEQDNHIWRGKIRLRTPETVKTWFSNYEKWLMNYVDLAIRQNVAAMTVGVELWNVSQHEEEWRNLIAAVRERGYQGALTYAALHHEYAGIRFWDALDFVGIDAYFGATRSNDPTLRQIIAGWERVARRMRDFSERVGKRVIFTEIGFNNLDGCNARPWYWSGNVADVDNIEQAQCYLAALAALSGEPWLEGMFWWTWDPASPVPPDEPTYSPHGKIAEMVLEAYYREPHLEVAPPKSLLDIFLEGMGF